MSLLIERNSIFIFISQRHEVKTCALSLFAKCILSKKGLASRKKPMLHVQLTHHIKGISTTISKSEMTDILISMSLLIERNSIFIFISQRHEVKTCALSLFAKCILSKKGLASRKKKHVTCTAVYV